MSGKEQSCTGHFKDSYEAETVKQAGMTYLMLRCPTCNRPQGMRLVRKIRT